MRHMHVQAGVPTVPTIAEPAESYTPRSSSADLGDILIELHEHGIAVTPLSVISRAVDLDVPEERVIEMAAEVRELARRAA